VAFYLNILATEFLGFDSARQTLRTLEFFWAKRYELVYRVGGGGLFMPQHIAPLRMANMLRGQRS
jgi:hypothetical protein